MGAGPQAGWGLGFWKDLSNAVRSLGSVGSPMTMLGTKAASPLTSFAVSSHNGISTVEPDAADDGKLGIRPVEPFIVIVHSQTWGERMLSETSVCHARLGTENRADCLLSTAALPCSYDLSQLPIRETLPRLSA